VSKYDIQADRRPQTGEGEPVINFQLDAEDYKSAWQDGRQLTAKGGTAHAADGSEVEVRPGEYTVRKVFAVDRARGAGRKPKSLSAQILFEKAEERKIGVSKSLRHLFEELSGTASTAETKPEDQKVA
jgi:hypothetical protein